MPSLTEIREKIPFLSLWETQRFWGLRVDYHEGLKRAPYQINIDLQRLHSLLKEFSFWGTKSDESDTHIIVDVAKKINRLVGTRRIGQLENKEPSHPCVMRLYGGSIYEGYLERSKTLSLKSAQALTQQEIATTIVHEQAHFLLWGMDKEKLEEARRKIMAMAAPGILLDEEETLCELISAEIAFGDPRWFGCVEFSPKSPSRVSGVSS